MSKEQFKALTKRWKEDTINVSSIRRIVEHPAYQSITAMGAEAVPFILEDLQSNADHWSHALTAITGESPVPEGKWGDIQAMADAWINWGVSRGFIKK